MILYIKNMVSRPGIIAVEHELEALGFNCTAVELGQAHITDDYITKAQEQQIDARLKPYGLTLMTDCKTRLVEKIKSIVIYFIQQEVDVNVNFSTYISSQLHLNYNYLSNFFSDMQGMTIKQFMILQRIERVKELLVYEELTLSEIADRLQYSSLAHMSLQFKSVTGISPSDFKHSRHKTLTPIEEVDKPELNP